MVHEMNKHMSPIKALKYFGVSKRVWYYTNKPKIIPIYKDATRYDR